MRIPHRDRVKDPSILHTPTCSRAYPCIHEDTETHATYGRARARTREAPALGALVPHGRYGLVEPSGVGKGLKGGK